MTDAFIVDASVGVAWVYPSQASAATDKLLNELAEGAVVVVPALWFLEIANGLLAAQRRRLITTSERRNALEKLLALHLTVDDATARGSCGPVSELAQYLGLSVYDAIYLDVAQRRKMPLATRDRAVRDAAVRCGVALCG